MSSTHQRRLRGGWRPSWKWRPGIRAPGQGIEGKEAGSLSCELTGNVHEQQGMLAAPEAEGEQKAQDTVARPSVPGVKATASPKRQPGAAGREKPPHDLKRLAGSGGGGCGSVRGQWGGS